MTITTYFPIDGLEAVCTGGTVELRQGSRPVMWMTFFDTGLFTVREPGRGHAGRFPDALVAADVKVLVRFALSSFRERRAA